MICESTSKSLVNKLINYISIVVDIHVILKSASIIHTKVKLQKLQGHHVLFLSHQITLGRKGEILGGL